MNSAQTVWVFTRPLDYDGRFRLNQAAANRIEAKEITVSAARLMYALEYTLQSVLVRRLHRLGLSEAVASQYLRALEARGLLTVEFVSVHSLMMNPSRM